MKGQNNNVDENYDTARMMTTLKPEYLGEHLLLAAPGHDGVHHHELHKVHVAVIVGVVDPEPVLVRNIPTIQIFE